MASSRKPKGLEEDLAKQILKLIRKGTPKAVKEADRLKGIQKVLREDRAVAAKGKTQLIREWDRKLGAEYYAAKRASEAKSVSQRLREESALRGMDKKFKGVGKRQSANETKTISDAASRADKKRFYKESGGRNSPDRREARAALAQRRRDAAKTKTQSGGAGKGPKPPKKTGTASAPKGPKKPRNNKK